MTEAVRTCLRGNMTDFAYEVAEVVGQTSRCPMYRYSIYRLHPQVKLVFVGEKPTYAEAETEAKKYVQGAYIVIERMVGGDFSA